MRLSQGTALHLLALAYGVGALAFLVEMTGGSWDIQWHFAGRVETFWTPPHTVLYGGIGVVALVSFGGLGLRFLGPAAPRPLEFGLRVMALGVALQFGAGAFDNWWHAVYGVDDVLSPPHVLLILGMNVVAIGLVVGMTRQFRSPAEGTSLGRWARRLLVVALPVGFAGWYFALWGMAWVLTFPSFVGPTFLLPALWQRSVVAFVFAALIPLVTLVAVRTVPLRGVATGLLAVATLSYYGVGALMGDAYADPREGPLLFLLGIVTFLVPGIAADTALRRPSGSALAGWAVGVGVLDGLLLALFQTGPVEWMTGGLAANPGWFPSLYAAGGVVGALLGLLTVRALRPARAATGAGAAG